MAKKTNEGSRIAGVRQAKAQFSALVHDARNGREWVISERGVPVAKLVPIQRDELTLEERLRRLESAGEIGPISRAERPLPPPLPLEDGLAQKMLQRDRDGG